MPCSLIKLPGGIGAIVCTGRTRTKRCFCRAPAPFLCDWKVGANATCDAPICADHALEVAPEKHLCPRHQETYARWKEKRGAHA